MRICVPGSERSLCAILSLSQFSTLHRCGNSWGQQHNRHHWSQHSAESGREPNEENQGCGLDTTFKKSTPEHYKWGMREPNGTPKGYNLWCITGLWYHEVFLSLVKDQTTSFREVSHSNSPFISPHLDIILYCGTAILKCYHGILSTGLARSENKDQSH